MNVQVMWNWYHWNGSSVHKHDADEEGLRYIAPKAQRKRGSHGHLSQQIILQLGMLEGCASDGMGEAHPFRAYDKLRDLKASFVLNGIWKQTGSFQEHYYLSLLVVKVGRAQNSKCIATGFQICGTQIWRSFMLTAQANSNVFLMRKQWCTTVCGLVFRQMHTATSISCSLPTVHTLWAIIVLAYIQSPQVAWRT